MLRLNCVVLLAWSFIPTFSTAQEPAGRTDFNVADRLAIQNVIGSHFLNLDSSQIEAWAANYTDDAVFVGIIGEKRYESEKPVFVKFFRDRFKDFRANGDQRRHLVSNVCFVEQSEETAHIKANGLLLTTNKGGDPDLVGGLTYEGWFVKRDGIWKISKWMVRGDTNVTIEPAQGMRVSEEKQ
jgi:ketosteroid isomerase-like protein